MQIDGFEETEVRPSCLPLQTRKIFKITAVCEKIISEIKGSQVCLVILK